MNRRILLVDDEPDVLAYFSAELKDYGYDVGTAPDGVEAVLKVVGGGYQVVLMDIRMPKLDGIGALRIIRRITPSIPVIMFTGQAGQGDMAESTRQGAYACLSKPVSFDRLLGILRQLFSTHVMIG